MRFAPVNRLVSRSTMLLTFGGAMLLGTWRDAAAILPRAVLKSYFKESPGSTATQATAFDTKIQLTYTGGLVGTAAPSAATTALYLYDASGEPLTSGTGAVVCAPCTFESGIGGSAPRRRTIAIEDLIMAAGGFGSTPKPREGFAVLDVTGDHDHLTAGVQVLSGHGTPGQPQTLAKVPRSVLKDFFERGDQPTQYTVPKLDGIDDWDVGDWAIFSATYLGGIGGVEPGTGATLEAYWFDENGAPMTNGTGTPVCAPCTYALGNGGGSAPRNVDLRFPPTPTSSGAGFAILRVAGADPSSVVIEETDMDSVMFGAVPMVLVTAGRLLDSPFLEQSGTTAVHAPDVVGAALSLRGSPNPTAAGVAFTFELERAAHVDLDVFDAAGRRVTTVASGWRTAGAHEVRWDRRDAAGQVTAAGIYYGRLRAGDGSRVTRLVFLPK